MSSPGWVVDLERRAPSVVAIWRAIDAGADTDRDQLFTLRRALRARVSVGDAEAIFAEQEAVADALEAILGRVSESALRAPGGEEDWNVAQTFAHTTAARRFLTAWAADAASGAWQADDPPRIRPSIPGPADASRQTLFALLDKSRRSMGESATRIAGHETEPCPLVHPLIGRLRCGEWLLFVGVHDVMHLEQLHRLVGED